MTDIESVYQVTSIDFINYGTTSPKSMVESFSWETCIQIMID
jgi:hypothetical protein